jgi:peptide/nickel transport system substrate-binding protein
MKRRRFLQALPAAALPLPAIAQGRGAHTLRLIHGSDLGSLDPVWTTAPPTKDYAFLVYDQLLAVDADYIPRPQMAEGWVVEDDGRSYVISLREGLRFHDDEPVRAPDCIASIRRWSARDGFGQVLARAIDTMEVIDDGRFRIRLKTPFPLLPAALGKSNSSQCFIMPERVANTDPMKQIAESIGSGPYRFLRDEWIAGARAAFARFDGYTPRPEPVSGIAGGRNPACERVEWTIIADPATALAAMQAGEQDYWDSPLHDLLPIMRKDSSLIVHARNTSGSYGMLCMNQLQKPFSNPAIRQAVAMAINQTDYLRATVGDDPDFMKVCHSFFACGTPYGTDAGAEVLKVQNLDRARAALHTAGYAGEKVVILAPADPPFVGAMGQVTNDLLRRLGMAVEFVACDFATMSQRRVSHAPTEDGGWSIFHTVWAGTDVLNPAVNQLLRGAGTAGWFGWCTDEKLEALRSQWFGENDPAVAAQVAKDLQIEAFTSLPYIPLGSTIAPVVWNKRLTGVFDCPVAAYWNIGKAS